ncbi:MAG TPA: polysaccharide deacetylase family protein [Bradyrhizobium sp.]|nr:polysaccharide deacetylase family protein [Bradyrhizobium sp.]
MRSALGLMLATLVSAGLIVAIWYWTAAPHIRIASAPATVAAAPSPKLAANEAARAATEANSTDLTAAIAARPATSAPAPAAPAPIMAAQAETPCSNPDALGVSRVVEVDTTGGPGFGFEHFKQFDFLSDKEVVLTFDDGPWPGNTPAVLKALADQCTKAVFFSIGKHASWHPEILRQVLAAGHTVGTHTWSHADLNSKKLGPQQVKDEIEMGMSAVKLALGTAPAPFFRFPELQHNPEAVAYLGQRNVAIFSCDIDSQDYKKASTPEKIIENVMGRLDKLGKGIILMHDFQKHTAEALPELLRRLKAGGYKVVQMKARAPLQTLPEYDAMVQKDIKQPIASARPVSSVVQTVAR